MQLRSKKAIAALASAIGLTAIAFIASRAADPDALWKIVHDRCMPDQTGHNDPAPCALVDLTGHWAVFKDAVGKTQFLLLATDRVTGIEDPQILAPQAPNYWEAAWEARRFVTQRAPHELADDQLALAINSRAARSQNQLHIHVDCIRPEVRDALRQMQSRIGTAWTSTRLSGEEYKIRRIGPEELHVTNLFALVAAQLQPGQEMDLETIAVVGAPAPEDGGLDLLVGRSGIGGNKGSAEALQDHGCSVARSAAGSAR
jgi:CDP-diacylglycerol pyrophosphatase